MFVALMIIGGIVSFVGGIMVLIAAFKESVLWGLGCLFVPFVNLIFIVMHWPEAKRGFFVQLAGAALIIIAIMIGVATSPGTPG